MRVGLFRRSASFLADAMPIFIIISILFSLTLRDALKPEGFDAAYDDYQEQSEIYFGDLNEQFENGDITQEEYLEQYDEILPAFEEEIAEYNVLFFQYSVRIVLFHLLSFIILYLIYTYVTGGRTMGRRMMRIELSGKVTFWRLFVREVVWRYMYWTVTLFIGGILIDIAMISFSDRKQTLRDKISGIYVKYEGADYPF
jgi:hypothetical protein